MSAHEDKNTGEAQTGISEGSEDNSMRFSPGLVDERKKASLEPLHAQISVLSEMMDCLIQSNSAKEATTASSRGIKHLYESLYSETLGSSGFPTIASFTTAGFCPTMRSFFASCFPV